MVQTAEVGRPTKFPYVAALDGLRGIFVLVIGVVFMGHRIGPWRVLAVICGFGGAMMVLGPDASNFSWVILAPVAGGFFYALGALATRFSVWAHSGCCISTAANA